MYPTRLCTTHFPLAPGMPCFPIAPVMKPAAAHEITPSGAVPRIEDSPLETKSRWGWLTTFVNYICSKLFSKKSRPSPADGPALAAAGRSYDAKARDEVVALASKVVRVVEAARIRFARFPSRTRTESEIQGYIQTLRKCKDSALPVVFGSVFQARKTMLGPDVFGLINGNDRFIVFKDIFIGSGSTKHVYFAIKLSGQDAHEVVASFPFDGSQRAICGDDRTTHHNFRRELLRQALLKDGLSQINEQPDGLNLAEITIPQITEQEKISGQLDHCASIAISPLCGSDLSEKRDLNIGSIVSIFSDIAKALSKLHRAGFSHNDLKTQNVLVNEFGRATIFDFDLSGTFGARHGGSWETQPPEWARNNSVSSPATDVWSFGVMLFECLATEYNGNPLPLYLDGVWKRLLSKPDLKQEEIDAFIDLKINQYGPKTFTGAQRGQQKKVLKAILKINPYQRPQTSELAALVATLRP